MGALVPSFLFDFESEMQRITEYEFARLSASDHLWWREVCKVRPSGKKREIIAFLLSNAQIYDAGYTGGNLVSDEMAAVYQEYDLRNSGAMLELTKNQVTDNDGDGFDFAGEWSANMGAMGAYWPQFLATQFLLSGATLTGNPVIQSNVGYDGVAFFASGATAHPYNPKQTGLGGFANWFTGAASLPYPGACPIDESVPLETALKNLQIAFSYIRTIKMPNGVTPRFLRPKGLLVAPRLETRAKMLTRGDTLPFSAVSGGGSADVSGDKTAAKGLEVWVADEFAGATTGDGKSADLIYYIICEVIQSSQLGGVVYVDREPFRVTYYTGDGGGNGVDAVLDRARTLEWHIQGRNVIGPGHPYAIFRADNT